MKRIDHQLSGTVVLGQCRNPQFGSPTLASVHTGETRMRFRRYAAGLALCLLSQMCLLHNMSAQEGSTGAITGIVTDQSGALIPSAAVAVIDESTQITINVKTTGSGDYMAPFLQPGSYEVKVTQPGFQTYEHNHIVILVDQTARVDVQLKVGQTSEVVTVTTGAVQLDTETSQMELVFTGDLVEDLPFVGRNVYDLAELAPGTSMAMSYHASNSHTPLNDDPGRVDVQGSRAFTTDATVNGGNIVLPTSDNFQYDVPALAAVQEFGVVQNNFGAQYGLGTSAENIITKSGTNSFHGSAFEYDENTAFDAQHGFVAAGSPKAVLHYNQFGGIIGGPILRNKLFFFFSYQNTIQPQSATYIITVPTADMLAGNFTQFANPIYDPATQVGSDPTTRTQFDYNGVPNTINPNRFDTIAKNILTYWPAPNYGAAGAVASNYYRDEATTSSNPVYDWKVDWVLSPAHHIALTAHNYKLIGTADGEIPGPACYNTEGCESNGQQEYFWNGSWTWIVNPHLVNAFYATFLREHFYASNPTFEQNYPTKLGFPNSNMPPYEFPLIYITNGSASETSIGPGSYSNTAQGNSMVSDVLTWVRGRHSFTAGGQFRKIYINPAPSYGDPTFDFNGQYTQNPTVSGSGNGFADFLLGDVQEYQYNANLTQLNSRRPAGAAFIQDDWKVTHGLTINLGLRWAHEGSWYNLNEKDANFSPTTPNPSNTYWNPTTGKFVSAGGAGIITIPAGSPGAIVFATGNNWPLQQNHPWLFAPRFGFAKTIGPNTVVRSGIGLYYQQTSGDQVQTRTPGFATSLTVQSTSPATPQVFQLEAGPPPYTIPGAASRTGDISNGGTFWYYPFNNRNPFSTEWQLSVERQLGQHTRAEVAYVGSTGRHLLDMIDSNQVPLSQLGSPLDRTDPQMARPFPQYVAISQTTINNTNSRYNALEIELKRRLNKGFSILTNYTYSKSEDQSSLDLTDWVGNDSQNQVDKPMAPSNFDERNRLVVAPIYELPFGKDRTWLNQSNTLDEILGGWDVAGAFDIHSGYPVTISAGVSSLQTGALAGGLFANKVGNQPDPHTAAEWFNLANYADPAPYTYGNSGRDSMVVPGFWNLDANLKKTFRITEKVQLQFRADAFNAFNHKNLYEPTKYLDATNSAKITASTLSRVIQIGSQINF